MTRSEPSGGERRRQPKHLQRRKARAASPPKEQRLSPGCSRLPRARAPSLRSKTRGGPRPGAEERPVLGRGERRVASCGALTLTVGACAGVARGCTNRSTDERAKDKIEPVGCKDLEDTSSTLGRGAAAGRGFAPRHYEGQDEKYQQGGQTHMAVLSSNPMQCHYEFPRHRGTQYNEALTLVGQTMQASVQPAVPRLSTLLTFFRGQYAKLLATIRSLGFFPAVSPSPRIHGLCVWVCVRLCFSFVPDAAWGVGCWSGSRDVALVRSSSRLCGISVGSTGSTRPALGTVLHVLWPYLGVLFCSDTLGQARGDSDTQTISKSLGKPHLAERQVRRSTASERTKTKRNFITLIMLHPSSGAR